MVRVDPGQRRPLNGGEVLKRRGKREKWFWNHQKTESWQLTTFLGMEGTGGGHGTTTSLTGRVSPNWRRGPKERGFRNTIFRYRSKKLGGEEEES